MGNEQYIWQPVARMNPNINIDDRMATYLANHGAKFTITVEGLEAVAVLRGDLALCRRVPASAGVPVEAIRKLIAFVDEWGSIGDTEGMPNLWIEVAEARTWLDRITTAEQYAQPQTGQEGNRE